MKTIVSGLVAALFALLASGCSVMAPNYSASVDNVETLKKAGDFHARVGDFISLAGEGNVNPVSLRGTKMASPYQNSYAAYVAEAIRQELILAQRLAPNAGVELSGTLLRNDVNADIGTGHAYMKMQLIVKRNDKVSYDRVMSVEHQWDSSFMGSVAIPRAIEEYPVLVRKMLALLYADKDFINAIK